MRILTPLVLSALLFGACCGVNRLAARETPIEKVSLGVESGDEVHLVFTRRVSRATRVITGSLSRVSASADRFDRLVAALREPMLIRSLQRGLAVALDETLGWQSGPSPLEFNLVIEEILLTSAGPLTPLTSVWTVEASLLDTDRGEVLWRRCLSLEIGHGGLSARDLARMEPERFVGFLRQMSTEVTGRLVQSLREDLAEAGGGKK